MNTRFNIFKANKINQIIKLESYHFESQNAECKLAVSISAKTK